MRQRASSSFTTDKPADRIWIAGAIQKYRDADGLRRKVKNFRER
jgi:hypothetical protein